MSTIHELEADEARLVAEIVPRTKALEGVRATLAAERSKEFIRVNKISADDIQQDSGDDLPWFGDVRSLIAYIKNNNITKPYTAWNGRIFLTSELLGGKFVPTAGSVENVEGWRAGQ